MKSLITICATIFMMINGYTQAPNKMSYQSVIRNSANSLVTNQAVRMRISILQTTVTGTAVYVEMQTPTTNANGLISIEIGGGTVISGNFSTINWANGPYFIKTETDPTGGTNYTITGTSQLLSVPYALFSEKADTAIISLDQYWSKTDNNIHFNSGNIGVGFVISNPMHLLCLNPVAGTRDGIEFRDQNSSNFGMKILYNEITNQLQFVSNHAGVENDIITLNRLNSFVGVGTSVPETTLHVDGVMRLEPRSTAPTSPARGDMYFDSTINKLRVYDGTTWQNCW